MRYDKRIKALISQFYQPYRVVPLASSLILKRSSNRVQIQSTYKFRISFSNRCTLSGMPPMDSEFKLPYSDVVGLDPSLDEMRKVVCIEKLRPNLPNHWTSDPLLTEMSKVLQECWYEAASSRLTALRIKKNLSTLNKTVNPVQKSTLLQKS